MSAALLENFELLAASVGGVAKLRELILSLAVRGRLVPQDPNDEPASELLKRIRAEKDRLVKEGKIKRDKLLAEVAANEKPHVLPGGWEWTRAADLYAVITDGDHQAPPRRDKGVPFLVIGDVVAGTVNLASASRFVPPEYFDGLGWQKQPSHGDILYTTVGSYGVPIPVVETKQFCFQRHIALLRPAIIG